MKERREEQIEEVAVTPSSGNVFADLGLADAEELLAKSTIAMKINQIIEKRHLSQTQAAALLGITQPKVLTPRQYRSGSVGRFRRSITSFATKTRFLFRSVRGSTMPISCSCARARLAAGKAMPLNRGAQPRLRRCRSSGFFGAS